MATLLSKIWRHHEISQATDYLPSKIYVDFQLLHEVTSPQAFEEMRIRGLKIKHPERHLATVDHSSPSKPKENGEWSFATAAAKLQVDTLYKNCRDFEIPILPLDHPQNGVVHVIGPELGLTQPGMTLACGDSHACTHGALGCLAFGIGTTEVAHIMASQCLFMTKPKSMFIQVEGTLPHDSTAKDIILYILSVMGTAKAHGYVIEFGGSTITDLSIEERMTVCNMAVELGAVSGIIAPDQKTFDYIKDKAYAPKGEEWQRAISSWKALYSDALSDFDAIESFEARHMHPRITYGTNPSLSVPLSSSIPSSTPLEDLDYMGWTQNQPMVDHPVDVVFVGSCANGRIGDIQEVANIIRGKKVAEGVKLLVVPGSSQVKKEAETNGYHHQITQAGGIWGEPGCSMCNAVNGDQLGPGQLAVSTTNRNFKGRQGHKGRTLLASPRTAAKIALKGSLL